MLNYTFIKIKSYLLVPVLLDLGFFPFFIPFLARFFEVFSNTMPPLFVCEASLPEIFLPCAFAFLRAALDSTLFLTALFFFCAFADDFLCFFLAVGLSL